MTSLQRFTAALYTAAALLTTFVDVRAALAPSAIAYSHIIIIIIIIIIYKIVHKVSDRQTNIKNNKNSKREH